MFENEKTNLKIVGVIPARYASTRFPGKPLADICGRPMIWWVYQQVKKVSDLKDVIIATDDDRIKLICLKYDIPVIITQNNHPNHISRVHEVSEHIKADFYICVNGDEPLIESDSIIRLLPDSIYEDEYLCCAMRVLKDPVETIDFSNLKVITDETGYCIYMSRAPIPYPCGTLSFHYNKYVGVECFNKKALDFFINTPKGKIEKIEDIDHLRFLENRRKIQFKYVESESISVDTPKDLEKIRSIIRTKINNGEIDI